MSERYELEELVIDDSFVNYCFRRQEADVARWEAYLRQYPDEAATMAEAREMVLGISVMFWETQPAPVSKPFPLRRTLAVAASIAVIVLAGYWLLRPARQPVAGLAVKPEVFITMLAEKKTIRLPDSSTVILNAGSELRLDSGFGIKQRCVRLKGEALFDVEPDAGKPFIVKVEDYDVKVLGTVFNVKSYPGDKNSETSLLSGKVEIQLSNHPSASKVLRPKEKFVINKAAAPLQPVTGAGIDSPKAATLQTAVRPLSYNRNQMNIETAWSENRLVIENETFGDIREKLERWFDVSIQFDDKAIEAYRFTATFEKENIVQVLKALQASYSFTFTKEGRSIRISR
ncbi:FecR domain-containing protein [Chitinophaga sp. YIM B06452]|uniref:FecR family protein n=1 Tax=Chitinophaga sp. YIM B06452 TaxID=3082158 RepID=UPI0031FE9C49